MKKFIENPNNNKAWDKLIENGYNPCKFMYMYSRSDTEYFFKHIDTRQYVTVFVTEKVK